MPRMALFISLTALLPLPAGGHAEDSEADKQAKQAVDKFFAALKAKDIDAVMKTVDVPWFHDGRRILRDAKDLKAELEQLLKSKDLTNLSYEIRQVISYAEVRGDLDDTTRNLGDEVLDKAQDDRVVLLSVKNPKPEKLILLVRIRKGEARIVGLQN